MPDTRIEPSACLVKVAPAFDLVLTISSGCHTGKRYRICHGNGANIIELDDAALPRTGWCFVPRDPLVAGDVMLAQKIALETDERGALAVANNFTLR